MNYLEEDLNIISNELNSFSGNKFLITGATGLIGSLCVKAIQKNGNVSAVALARDYKKVESMFDKTDNVKFLYQDITRIIPDDIECDYIIHTANPTTSKYFISNPVEVIDGICIGTKQILDYAYKHKVKGVVYLSSMEVYGVVNKDERVKEDELGYIDINNVRSSYSEGKRCAELLCKCYAQEYDVPVKIARLAQTFGAGVSEHDNRVFMQFAKSAINGEDIVLHTKGESYGNYCYTTDTIRALLLLLKKAIPGEAYNIVNEETTRTIYEMAELVVNKFSNGRSKVVFDIPKENKYGYAPDTKLKLSSEKLNKLSWFAEYSLEEIFERMIKGLKNQLYKEKK